MGSDDARSNPGYTPSVKGVCHVPGQRLLAELDLFTNPRVVLEDPKYWNPDFARHFIEAWDDVAYVDPHAGMRLARTAVELVELLDEDDRPILLPRALATVGSSHRALEELHEAEAVFAQVAALHEKTLIPRLDEADYCRRMTYFRRDQGRYVEALTFAEKTIVLCQAEQASHDLGSAYAARGSVYLLMIWTGDAVPRSEPIQSLSLAVERIDPRKSQYAYEAATGNLALSLLEGYDCDLEMTLATLKKTLRLQAKLRITKKTLPNAIVRWMIGLVYLRIGFLDRAGEILRRARRVLMQLGFLKDVVRISLDLARVYHAQGFWGRLRVLAEEILSLEEVYTPEALTALRVWHEAILREHVPERTWKRVLDAVRWEPLAPGHKRQRQPITFIRRESTRDPRLW